MHDINKDSTYNFEKVTNFGDQYTVELELVDGEYAPGEDFIINGTFEGERSNGSILYTCKDNVLAAHINIRVELWESLDEDNDDIEELEIEDDRFIERECDPIAKDDLEVFESELEDVLEMLSYGIVESVEDTDDLYYD